jgi:hypothetical protein
MARRYHELRRHVRFWHLADIGLDAEKVRFEVQSGHGCQTSLSNPQTAS